MDNAPRPSTFSGARCLPADEWPALDRNLWTRAQQKPGLLDEPRPAADWAPLTQEAVAKAYGRWLHWLMANGMLDPSAPPERRLTLERIKDYVRELQACNAPNTVHMRLLHLGRMLEVIAPGSRPAWFPRVLRTLRASHQPVRDDRTRLLPVRDLLALGWRLTEQAEQRADWSLRRRALHHRDGLLILFLCAHALRANSLARLKISDHLQRRGDGWWIALGRTEIKNRRPIELPLPDAFNGALERHLAHWRPILLARQRIYGTATPVDSMHFWLSESGGALRPKDFNWIVNSVTRRELGRALNPHLFRKLVPTELAIRDPAHVAIARSLLGHVSYETTDQAYNLACALDSARRVHATLGALRREAKDSATSLRKEVR